MYLTCSRASKKLTCSQLSPPHVVTDRRTYTRRKQCLLPFQRDEHEKQFSTFYRQSSIRIQNARICSRHITWENTSLNTFYAQPTSNLRIFLLVTYIFFFILCCVKHPKNVTASCCKTIQLFHTYGHNKMRTSRFITQAYRTKYDSFDCYVKLRVIQRIA